MKRIVSIALMVIATMLLLTWIRNGRNLEQCAVPEELIIGTSADFAPFSFLKANEIVGFDIDVMAEVARRLGKKMVIKDMPFDVLIPQIRLGQVHVIAAGMSATPERSEQVQFSLPYLVHDPLVMVTRKQGPVVSNLLALNGKKVVVNRGYTADLYLSQYPKIKIERVGNVEEAVAILLAGQADVFVTASNTLKPILERHSEEQFTAVALPDTEENIAFAVAQERLPLLQEINRSLAALQDDGTLEALKQKWRVS